MSLFEAGLNPALDDNGDPISGARWYFYLDGTLTPTPAYADPDLGTSVGSYITADSSGRFDPTYLDDTILTRAILKDAGGATIAPYDIAGVNAATPISGGNLSTTGYKTYYEITSPKTALTLQGWWPSTNDAEAFVGITHAVDSDTTVVTGHPVTALTTLITHEPGSPDVAACGAQFGAINRNTTNSGRQVVAVNGIAQSFFGTSGTHATGSEMDIQITPGDTMCFTIGHVSNVLYGNSHGIAFLVGYDSMDGRWRAGLEVALGSIDPALAAIRPYPDANSGNIFIDSSTAFGGFTTAFMRLLGNQGRILFTDGSSNANGVLQGNESGRDVLLTLQHTSSAFRVIASNATEANQYASWRNSSGDDTAIMYVANGTGASSGDTALRINKNSVTNSSIRAAGAIGASGADYAEYETLRDDCAPFAKGDIVGFDTDGLLTDKFDLAISFGIKSTNPGYTGGDDWSAHLVRPIAPDPPIKPSAAPEKGVVPVGKGIPAAQISAIVFEVERQHEEAIAAWEAKQAQYADDMAAYEIAQAQYERDLADFNTAHEEARSKVERIAYCGKVPANVTGAKPGDYLLPKRNADGSIGFKVLTKATTAQRLDAIARVRRILDDGRAEVAVGVR